MDDLATHVLGSSHVAPFIPHARQVAPSSSALRAYTSSRRWLSSSKSPSSSAKQRALMSALFNFSSFSVVVLLTICTCTYVKGKGRGVPTGRVASLLWAALGPSHTQTCAAFFSRPISCSP